MVCQRLFSIFRNQIGFLSGYESASFYFGVSFFLPVGSPRLERLVIVYRYYRRFSILFYYSFIDRYVGGSSLCAFLVGDIVPGFATLRRVLLFELPLVLFTVVYIMTGLFEVYMSSVVYTAVVCALVVLFIVVRVRRYNRYMRDNYSYTERINVQWLMNSMAILAVCLLSWLYVCTNVSHLGDMFYYISSTVLWAVVLYYSLRQEWIPQAQDMESEETGVSRNFVSQMGGKLEEYIREKELYLNPKLSLSDLAVEMGTNRKLFI